ncbi:LCP family protein, partial [Kibdelosporangium lantanae]
HRQLTVNRLATGDAKGQRTDTMILLHIPDNSEKATMVSLLRDSYLDIPGKGRNKLNAAYAFGGPKLLAQTVEKATNLRLDHYIEIGFGGFAGIVDDVIRARKGTTDASDLLGLMLDSDLGDVNIRNQVITFLIAGCPDTLNTSVNGPYAKIVVNQLSTVYEGSS